MTKNKSQTERNIYNAYKGWNTFIQHMQRTSANHLKTPSNFEQNNWKDISQRKILKWEISIWKGVLHLQSSVKGH